MNSVQDFQLVLTQMKEWVKKAGELVLAEVPTAGLVTKEGRGNIVTAADMASEKHLMDQINANYPDHKILTEESAATTNAPLTEAHLWVIDPVDGTNNFRFERGYSAVSLAYVEAGQPKVAAVYNPFNRELFTAIAGQGAWLNDNPIKVAEPLELAKGVLATDNSYFSEGTRRNLELVLKLPQTPMVMMRGSAVLIMCDIAAARLNLYFHTFLKPWDNAAAFLIAAEAGAKLCDLSGNAITFMSEDVVVGHPTVVDEFVIGIK